MHGEDRPVLVGVDGSDAALAAVRWAAAEAGRRRAGLRPLFAFARAPGPGPALPGPGDRLGTALRDSARRELERAARAAQQAAPGVAVRTDLRIGAPVEVLTAASRTAQLLVLGDHGRGRLGGVLLGSVAHAVAARAECPVVVVRGGAGSTGAGGPVVVGIDGSPTSEAALAFAYQAAADRSAELVAVHAWTDAVIDPVLALLLDRDALEVEERALLAERLAGWAEKFPGVPVRRVVALDRPAHALVEAADDAQLLVVGSRGRGAVAGLLLGSVGHAVLHRSPCPVAIVRPHPAEHDRGGAP